MIREIHQTALTDTVDRALDRLPRVGRVMLLHGPHGVGNTEALRRAAGGRPEGIPVTLPPPGKHVAPRTLLQEIGDAIGLPIGRDWSAHHTCRQVAAQVGDLGLTVVIDQCHRVAPWQIDWLCHLSDMLPHLVLAGSDKLYRLAARHGELSVRVRLPIEAEPLAEAELGRIFGDRLNLGAVAELHRATRGLWWAVENVLAIEGLACEKLGRSLYDSTAEDIRERARHLLGGLAAAA